MNQYGNVMLCYLTEKRKVENGAYEMLPFG